MAITLDQRIIDLLYGGHSIDAICNLLDVHPPDVQAAVQDLDNLPTMGQAEAESFTLAGDLSVGGDVAVTGGADVGGDLGVTGKFGANGATPVAKATAYTQTYSTAARVVPNATVAAVATTAATTETPYGYDSQEQADAVPVAINALAVDVLALKKVITALVDDLQAAGLVG